MDKITAPGEQRQSFVLSSSLKYAVFGKTTYETFTLGADYAVGRWYFHLSVPYVNNSRDRMMVTSDRLNVTGFSDITLMAWYNLTASPKPAIKEDKASVAGKDETKPKEKKEENKSNNPIFIMLGVGVKLPTGDDSVKDRFGIFPPELQPGSGTTDKLFGVALSKKLFTSATGFASTVYQATGGGNSINYEKKDRIYWNGGVTYELSKKNQLSASLAFSGMHVWEEDRNNGIKVPDTNGDWVYLGPSIGISPFENKNINFGLGFDFAIKEQADSRYGMDRSISISAGLGF